MNSSFILVVEFSNAFFKNGALKILDGREKKYHPLNSYTPKMFVCFISDLGSMALVLHTFKLKQQKCISIGSTSLNLPQGGNLIYCPSETFSLYT